MQERSKKKFWFAVHGWSALPIWGLLALICVTGTICTVTQEITWLYAPEVRAANPEDLAPRSWDELAGAVNSAYPDARLASIHNEESYLAYLVRIQLADGRGKRLYVNQYTGQVQGENQGPGLRGFMLELHGWLLFPWHDTYSVGWYLVTAASIPLLLSLVSGIVVFKRFWRVLYRPRLRWKKGRRVFWGDFHRLFAAWSIPFILIMATSGLWFLIQGVLDHNQVSVFPETPALSRQSVSIAADGEAPDMLSLDQVVAEAERVYPDLRVSYIEFPENTYAPFMVRGTRGISLLRDTAHAVYLNPYSGHVLGARSGPDLSPTQWLSALLVPLHFGDFAGLVSKLIWFFFGCLLSSIVCSGFAIWSKRALLSSGKGASPKIHSDASLMPSLRVRSPGKAFDMRRLRWCFNCSLLVLAAPVYFFLRQFSPEPPIFQEKESALVETPAGSWCVTFEDDAGFGMRIFYETPCRNCGTAGRCPEGFPRVK